MYKIENAYQYTKNLNILYVEDDLNFREETCDIFEDYFSNIDIASDGEKGLKKYLEYFKKSSKYYDIVITDINMPKMDGIELTKAIYKENINQPIIVVSAHNESKYLLELINLGIEQFLMKPLELDKIIEVFYKTAKKISYKEYDNKDKDIVNITNEYVWDKKALQLFYKSSIVKLSKKESLLIDLLIKNKDKVSTIDEIFYALWKEDFYSATIESLKAIPSRFRKKVPDIKVENVYGLGYRLS